MKKILFILPVLFLAFSCSKDESTDIRDSYVGQWNLSANGSFTALAGSSSGTLPIIYTDVISISKSGNDILIIDGTNYVVAGNRITANSQNVTYVEDGVSFVGVENSTGTLNGNSIVINSTITGTWSDDDNNNGNFTGTVTYNLSK